MVMVVSVAMGWTFASFRDGETEGFQDAHRVGKCLRQLPLRRCFVC